MGGGHGQGLLSVCQLNLFLPFVQWGFFACSCCRSVSLHNRFSMPSFGFADKERYNSIWSSIGIPVHLCRASAFRLCHFKKKTSCLPMFVCIRCVCAFHCTYVHAYIYRHVRGGRAIYHLPLHEFPTSSSWMAAGLQWSLGKQKLLTDANLYLCVKNTNKQSAKVWLEKKKQSMWKWSILCVISWRLEIHG